MHRMLGERRSPVDSPAGGVTPREQVRGVEFDDPAQRRCVPRPALRRRDAALVEQLRGAGDGARLAEGRDDVVQSGIGIGDADDAAGFVALVAEAERRVLQYVAGAYVWSPCRPFARFFAFCSSSLSPIANAPGGGDDLDPVPASGMLQTEQVLNATVMRSGSAVVTEYCGMRRSNGRFKHESVDGGRHWTRTSDLLHVKQVL